MLLAVGRFMLQTSCNMASLAFNDCSAIATTPHAIIWGSCPPTRIKAYAAETATVPLLRQLLCWDLKQVLHSLIYLFIKLVPLQVNY